MRRKKMIRRCAGKMIFGIFLLWACCLTGVSSAGESDPVRVMVSILPQACFVENIGGDRVRVDVLVAPGKSPATYAPSPAQIASLAKAGVYFRVGVPFENVLFDRIGDVADRVFVVDTRRGIHLRKMEAGHQGHENEMSHVMAAVAAEGHSHDHEGRDPHIWLDPNLVKQQAATMCDALVRVDPAGEAVYRSNLAKFVSELEALHGRLKQILSPFQGENLYVFHPSFGYFADAYGLHQVAIEMEGKAPKGKDLYRFIQAAKASRARAIFVQPQFDRYAAEKIAAAIEGVVVSLDPLAADYMGNMEEMALKIAGAMKR